MEAIRIRLNNFPPSTNQAYFNGPRGRVLSAEGRRYQATTKDVISSQYGFQLWSIRKDVAYRIDYIFYTSVYTKKGASKFRRIDVTNRVKLLEDALTEVAGIDDSQCTTVVLRKVHSETEYVEIIIQEDVNEPNKAK